VSQAFAALQRLLPQHGLSRLIGRLARSRQPWIRRPIIRGFASAYDVDLDEAVIQDLDAFDCFNDFFTRALRPDARPIEPGAGRVVAPADGAISQFGTIRQGQLLQAKGNWYSLDSLVGDALNGRFDGGEFITIYLAPGDYHRVHAPLAGRLVRTTAIPGALFSVNARTEAAISDLFCRNERLVCHFDTDLGRVLVILVGALIVASIETAWSGPASPYRALQRDTQHIDFAKGDEIGRFLLGSTVIVCTEPGAVEWDATLHLGGRVEVGQGIGRAG
jgi:phosphatidylserine decarboxylase